MTVLGALSTFRKRREMSPHKRARVHEYPRTHFAVAIDLREWSPAQRKDRMPSHLVNDKGRSHQQPISFTDGKGGNRQPTLLMGAELLPRRNSRDGRKEPLPCFPEDASD
jgi:hypothetical protein